MEAITTEHAIERAKDRCGLNKSAAKRMSDRVLIIGKTHGDFSGAFKKYLDKLYFKYKTANNMRVYGQYIYLFNGNLLMTILNKPSKFRSVK